LYAIIWASVKGWYRLVLLLTQQVKAFRLDPAGRYGSDIQGGYIDLDGEILARGRGTVGDGSGDIMTYGPPVDVTVDQGLATIFCPAL
jgi:sphingosine kinase